MYGRPMRFATALRNAFAVVDSRFDRTIYYTNDADRAHRVADWRNKICSEPRYVVEPIYNV